MKNNFNLRTFLTENKLTSNSKTLKEVEYDKEYDIAKSHTDELEDATFPVAEAFKKVGIDMSKDVHVHYQDGGPPGLGAGRLKDKGVQSAESVLKMLEEHRQKEIKEYEEFVQSDDGYEMEFPVMYEYYYYGGKKFTPEGKEFKLTYSVFEGESWDLFQEPSGVSEEVNEQLASQAIQEFIAADNNGVSIAEFVKAIIDGAAEFNQEDAAYQDLDKRSEVILKAIGRQDLIGGTNETAPGYMHDCAAKVMHEKYGNGDCIPEQHTLVKEGTKYVVTHYDVLFESGKTVKNIPVKELKIITESHHGHKRRKK